MRVADVRQWANGRGIRAAEFRRVYDGALLHVTSRLLQAIHRESRVTRLSQDAHGRWHLDIGRRSVMRAPVSGPLPFRRLETIGRPWLIGPGKRRRVRTVRAFLAALRK
jgi:hypothetical protein